MFVVTTGTCLLSLLAHVCCHYWHTFVVTTGTCLLSLLAHVMEAEMFELSSSGVFQVDEVQNVYDEVDEGEYSKIVQNRQEEDWIIDDG